MLLDFLQVSGSFQGISKQTLHSVYKVRLFFYCPCFILVKYSVSPQLMPQSLCTTQITNHCFKPPDYCQHRAMLKLNQNLNAHVLLAFSTVVGVKFSFLCHHFFSCLPFDCHCLIMARRYNGHNVIATIKVKTLV